MIVPLIESTRLRLRQYRASDLQHFAALNSDPQVRNHVGGVLTQQQIDCHMANFTAMTDPVDLWAWAVESAETGEYIGHAWLMQQDGPYQPESGILIARSHWGNRYAPEAMLEVVQFAYRELGCASVHASVDTDNTKSIAMLHRAGFELLVTEEDEEGSYFVFVCQ